jgi:competence protein ComEA
VDTSTSRNRRLRSASFLPAFTALLIGVTVVAAVVTTAALVIADRFDRPSMIVGPAELPTITAQIDGSVATPGVYPLPAGARLDDLVTGAGGLAPDADVSDLNLAARVADGERIVIPSLARATPAPEPTGGDDEDAPLLVNINTATVEELDRLPGIGPVIGERIVAYRQENGPFGSVDALAEVDGISDRLLERLRPYIALDD